ncbi:hypothetical protein IFM89_030451 [Coptis chinensis]|uniref:Uncharacterized protein n=1 Tax=Coptis chinensis TaxID=261450 RepID=A0A835LJ38_9MAGN|nr:hypothetical protein IFM89_030451 [Coptis chinensis]
MISSLSWVPKGVSKPIPAEAEPPTKEEIEEILKQNAIKLSEDEEINDVSQALAAANALTSFATQDVTDALGELNMDNYDDEEDGVELFGAGIGDTYYASNDMDPFIKKGEDDEDSEDEDMIIKPTDAVIVSASHEDDVSQLQVCILEELENGELNFYPHHDIILPAFPLCTEWFDCNLKGGDRGNFIAVGSMEPAIEIWDLDLVDEVQPFLVLGGVAVAKKKKNRKKTSIKYKKDSHTDSVLCLAWNKVARKYLASASADKSVKIWDLFTGECFNTREHHTDKAIVLTLIFVKVLECH